MAKALREVSQFEYVLKEDRGLPEEEQTKFQLFGLSGGQRTQVRDALYGGAEGREVNLTTNIKACELAIVFGLKGWENMQREQRDGTMVPLPYPKKPREAMGHLGDNTRVELGLAIMAASEITEAEAGN